jgi:epoxide hydrolase-like predicted phosphatase
MIDTVIFDAGNVLLKVENDYIRKDISKTLKISLKTAEKAWSALVPTLLGMGRISEKEFWERFFTLTKAKKVHVPRYLLSRELEKRFHSYPKSIKIVKSLKSKGYKLGMISDTIRAHARISKKHGLLEPFDVVILSYEVGLSKPDPKIFRLALKRLKSEPQSTVFIDDIPNYVKAARRLGIKGIILTSPTKLKEELIKIGIPSSDLTQ